VSSDGRSVRIISKWERLLDALDRVTGAGIPENEAKQGICDAIAGGAVEIRLELREHTTKQMVATGKVLTGADVEIPARLEPQEMDFKESRPLKPWAVRRERLFHFAGFWHIDWIEVSRDDVTKLFIPAGGSDQSFAAEGSRERLPRPRRKSQTGRDGARRALAALYPDGVPDAVAVPNATLCRIVGDKLKELGLPHISDDAILRAAGRRK
jgi:hypothetical protein